jgi:Barstar (barnase inhibitor)
MKLQPGLIMVGAAHLDSIVQAAKLEQVPVYVLPDAGVVDRTSFFDAIRATLPLDPPIQSARSWDALSDSLWAGLDKLDADQVLIVWPNAAAMIPASRMEYDQALMVLADVATSLADPKLTQGKPKQVSIIVGEDATTD